MLAGKIQGILVVEAWEPASGSKFASYLNLLRGNSLRNGTGNLFRASRELKRAIREIIHLIREPEQTAISPATTVDRVSEQWRTFGQAGGPAGFPGVGRPL